MSYRHVMVYIPNPGPGRLRLVGEIEENGWNIEPGYEMEVAIRLKPGQKPYISPRYRQGGVECIYAGAIDAEF